MKKLIAMIVILAAAQSIAATNVKTLEVKGFGDSPKEAVDNALYRSVAMAVGVSVDSGDFIYGHRSSNSGAAFSEDGNKYSRDDVALLTEGTVLKNKIKGFIKGYKVIDEGKNSDGKYFALLKVDISEYASPIKDDKDRLSIVSFSNPRSGPQIGKELASRLIDTISKQGDYRIVDREYSNEFSQERNVVDSKDSSISEKGRLGKVLGADFLLTGVIERADIIAKPKHSNATGQDYVEYKAYFDVRYSLLVAPTRELELSDRIEIHLDNDQVKALVKDWDYKDVDAGELKNGLLNMVASRIALQLSERVSPMRIADVWDDDSIVLNKGKGKVAVGMSFDVYSLGADVIDPETKESLGAAQHKIAKLEISEIYPKYCFAKRVSGKIDKSNIGDICRVNNDKKEVVGAKRRVERKSNGGVVLPFDK